IKLFYDLPVIDDPIKTEIKPDYEKLLSSHTAIHSEMFNRFSLDLDLKQRDTQFSEEMIASSAHGKLSTELVEQLCEASRYTLISSTGELPPTLQGIWGGTWRPAWSGDFTLNGNVPSAIACGLNASFPEVTEAYINYMWSMFEDFKDNARDLYGADGIFVPSRTSTFGKTYHYLEYYAHMFWYAGAAWTSQFFYDYWLYTGNEKFLKEKAIPFMLAAADFYEDMLIKDEEGKYLFIPSYSPEIEPLGYHPAAINATMDIAALKQLLRNLIRLEDEGWLGKDRMAGWEKIINNLPAYAVQEDGDLKEWIWPEYLNDNRHRHASHLYPLFYEVDPDFEERPELKRAAIQAIENRLQYRRDNNGAEMAFGLVQKGLAAAHLND
ncbi:alpha-L-fucosidase, partial [bacterium]|nr:alpha-L-fucosidase [bacterium]